MGPNFPRSTVLPIVSCQYGLIIAYIALSLCIIFKPNGNFHLVFFSELGMVIIGCWGRITGVKPFHLPPPPQLAIGVRLESPVVS